MGQTTSGNCVLTADRTVFLYKSVEALVGLPSHHTHTHTNAMDDGMHHRAARTDRMRVYACGEGLFTIAPTLVVVASVPVIQFDARRNAGTGCARIYIETGARTHDGGW